MDYYFDRFELEFSDRKNTHTTRGLARNFKQTNEQAFRRPLSKNTQRPNLFVTYFAQTHFGSGLVLSRFHAAAMSQLGVDRAYAESN